jgi:hypothetical protein
MEIDLLETRNNIDPCDDHWQKDKLSTVGWIRTSDLPTLEREN